MESEAFVCALFSSLMCLTSLHCTITDLVKTANFMCCFRLDWKVTGAINSWLMIILSCDCVTYNQVRLFWKNYLFWNLLSSCMSMTVFAFRKVQSPHIHSDHPKCKSRCKTRKKPPPTIKPSISQKFHWGKTFKDEQQWSVANFPFGILQFMLEIS